MRTFWIYTAATLAATGVGVGQTYLLIFLFGGGIWTGLTITLLAGAIALGFMVLADRLDTRHEPIRS